jgi:hypothetical protein
MAITLQCSRCMKEQKVDDDKASQEVPCRVCYQPIAVPGGQSGERSKPAAKKTEAKEKPRKPAETAIEKDKQTALTAKKPPPRRRDEDDNDDDDDFPRRRTRPISNDSSGLTGLLIGAGVFLVAALLCGGASFSAFFLFAGRAERVAEQEIAEVVAVQQPMQNVPPPRFAAPPGIGQPPFPPPPENLNPLDPNAADRVLAFLRGPKQQRGPALQWLNEADLNHPRRAEIAKQLDTLVDENRQNPFGNADFFNAYFKWATRDNVPTLIRLVDNDQQRRKQAMQTLGKLKDERAVEPLLKQLANIFDRQTAAEALTELGPVAEPGVVKFFNHADAQTRDLARRVLERYGTKSDRILTQCLADLGSLDANCRAGALQWLAKSPVDPQRKVEVSKALNLRMDELNGIRSRDLIAALETWATSENIPELSKLLTTTQLGSRDAIRILSKIQDPEATKAIARGMANFFNLQEARKVLKDMGEAAEPAVIEAMAMCNDVRALRDYVGLLGEIGTRKLSLPALTALSMRVRQDFILNTQMQQAAKAIQARGK